MFKLIATAIFTTSVGFATAAQAAPPTARFDDPTPTVAPSPQARPPNPATRPAPRPSVAKESWATRAARALSERARQARARGATGDALRLYTEAVRMDPSFGPAYLGLGELRAALGDWGEAERVYEMALRLPAAGAAALAARGRLRYQRGDVEGAVGDMEASLEREPRNTARLAQLAAWHVATQSWAAALVAWRRLLVQRERLGQDAAADQARTQIRALTILAAEADPVHGIGGAHPNWVRRALARIAVRLPVSQ